MVFTADRTRRSFFFSFGRYSASSGESVKPPNFPFCTLKQGQTGLLAKNRLKTLVLMAKKLKMCLILLIIQLLIYGYTNRNYRRC